MSHDTLSHTHLTGFPSQRDALLGRRVPRCENDIRLGTYLHDSHDFRQHTPVIVHDGHTLFLAVIADVLVNGILCRHPDTTTKIAGCGYGFFRSKYIYFIPVYPVHTQASEHLESL